MSSNLIRLLMVLSLISVASCGSSNSKFDDVGKDCSVSGDDECGGDTFCKFESPGICSAAAGVKGLCSATTQVCTQDINPVCGCDGNTYSNSCNADAAGVSILHPGECTAAVPAQ